MEGTPISTISSLQGVGGSLLQLIHLQGQLVFPKLDDNNYLLWKQQAEVTIGGYGLEGFITGETPVPEQFILGTSDSGTVVNLAFKAWLRQDRLITSWLLSSMTKSVLIALVGLTTSRDIWKTLESNFASQSRAKLMQMKNLGMVEYLNKVKNYCDILGVAGERVCDENHILHILTGLGAEYNPVMVSITLMLSLAT
ncbi:hypothetical protein C2S51_029303 [Perilla frutescens var. frutescens]|nr:hypothetical protein C2S51_029303 [Perilla frutescens var. frutescens]